MNKTDLTPAIVISKMTRATIEKILYHKESIEYVAIRIIKAINKPLQEKEIKLCEEEQPISYLPDDHDLTFKVNFETGEITDVTLKHFTEHPLDFGDYVYIEQKRYGVPNEIYLYKVVGRLRSNAYVNVPVVAGLNKNTIHHGNKNESAVVDVVACICCGVCEDEVLKFKVEDVKRRV